MLPIIIEAATNFCLHQIRLPFDFIDGSDKKRTLLAYIDIETTNDGLHRAYIGCDDRLIQMITEIFLGEEDSDEQTLVDMLLETTNMIVGSAKVLAGELYETTITIATPFILPEEESTTLHMDEIKCISVNGGEMTIGLQRL
ncbi:MAG: chemotaxis protein CheX [Sulfuricurvum sp.]|uniref:chemotaxis protein CheX n=1 Tax=Sulfuricurvum sp. TaxID=2025608 RepID=UPI0025F80D37|nr:chemotaxis protein CheX [Sulfuricurvum sp.]MBV5320695.1 chemotaxis protein CheX [Sulfuricurvum sp.]